MPLDRIVTELNIDMIGRNRDDKPGESNTLYLVGSDRISSELHAINRDGHRHGTDPFELFEKLGPVDPAHAFYLGYEMAKAVTALTLGKNYTQDQALRWGFLTREEKSHRSDDA